MPDADQLPLDAASPPHLAKNGATRGSATFANAEHVFTADFGGDMRCKFALFGLDVPPSREPSSNTAESDKDEAMLDILLDDFAANPTEAFSGFLPELRDLDSIAN